MTTAFNFLMLALLGYVGFYAIWWVTIRVWLLERQRFMVERISLEIPQTDAGELLRSRATGFLLHIHAMDVCTICYYSSLPESKQIADKIEKDNRLIDDSGLQKFRSDLSREVSIAVTANSPILFASCLFMLGFCAAGFGIMRGTVNTFQSRIWTQNELIPA